MRTIPADTVVKWINYLSGIESALQVVNDLRPMVPHEVWLKTHIAQIHAKGVRDQLMIFAVADVAVEPIEPPVRVGKIVPGAPAMERDVSLVMAAE